MNDFLNSLLKKYEDLNIIYYKANWIGDKLEYYDFKKDKYISFDGEVLSYVVFDTFKETIDLDKIELLVNNNIVLNHECFLVFFENKKRKYLGLIRGKNINFEKQVDNSYNFIDF